MRARAGHLLLGLICGTVACTGPVPKIEEVRIVAPSGNGEPYRVDFALRNEGRGEGQVSIDVRLKDPKGDSYQSDLKLDLAPHELTRGSVLITAPPGRYRAEVQAIYPPN